MKSGKTTFGSYGDIAFVDPIGAPLLELFTIELKRGSSHSHPGDLIDFKPENEKHISSQCLAQAYRSHRDAGSHAWMMIGRRDHRVAVCYIDQSLGVLKEESRAFARANCVKFNIKVRRKNSSPLHLKFVALSLQSFLERVSPKQIMECLENLRK